MECWVFPLENESVQRPETHRYHRYEPKPPRCLKGHPKGLAYVWVPTIVGPRIAQHDIERQAALFT